MHLTRLRIKNYRSIKELDLKFEKGKNVIVGKNNSGKSNIIKAIDLVLGEKSPAYAKSQNITEEDFFFGDTTEPIYIYCELEKDPEEPINYSEMRKNCNGFHIYGYYREKLPIFQYINPDANFFKNLDEIFSIDYDTSRDRYFISKNEILGFESEFDDKDNFAYIFKAWITESGAIQKDIRFIYRKKETYGWILSFGARIRNELLQSAIIPSFRDPSSQLRISDYSWYGKLLKNYTGKENPDFISACESVKAESNAMFNEIISEINDSEIDVAFPKTTISLQCSPKTIDAHKNALIYVDDGFESLLSEKGSGIQSVVIIGLFDFYTRKILHAGSSLLAIEEPELFLHPHGKRVLSNRLEKFLENDKNQVIMTTHAPEFITSVRNNINIITAKKTDENGTIAFNVSFNHPKNLQVISKAQNAELFFADKVILVEGADKFILEALAEELGRVCKKGENWLDVENVSIISVGGKSQFAHYVSILSELNIDWSILADFDFIRDGLKGFLGSITAGPEVVSKVSEINSELGNIDKRIVDADLPVKVISGIDQFSASVQSAGYPITRDKLIDIVKNSRKIKKLDDIPEGNEKIRIQIGELIEDLKILNTFILTGDLEHFYKDELREELRKKGYKKDGKKEQKVFYIISELLDEYSIEQLIEVYEIGAPLRQML